MWFLCLTALAAGSDFPQWLETLPPPDDLPSPAQQYRSASMAFHEIGVAMSEHPGVVRTEVIGESVRGEPLWAFHLGPPASDSTHSVLVFAQLHALEWIGTEVAVDLLLDLIEDPPDIAVTVIPIMNPDGRAKVENDIALGRSPHRRGNGPNVDLNRDWAVNRDPPAVWKHIIPGYYSHSDEPLSQPETRALDALVARERYTRAASLHSFGGYFYYPWSGAFERPPDRRDFMVLGDAMEDAQGRRAYRTRQLSHWGFFFRACGSEIDHLYGTYGTRAFLIELTRSGIRPGHLRHDWKTPFRWYNPRRSAPHRRRALPAMHALIDTPPLPGEEDGVEAPALPFAP